MRRRRLSLHYSSGEEDTEHHKQHHNQQQQQQSGPSQTLISTPNPNQPNTPVAPIPVDISDDEFVEANEEISPPSPPAPPAPAPVQIPIPVPLQFSSNTASHSPVDAFLRNLGLRLRREWFDSCISGLSRSIPGFSNLDVPGRAELCFAQFLFSDMNLSGAGVLPPNVHNLHLVDLPGPFVLQVDEIVNISRPLQGDRYRNAPAGSHRCLKLSMTDGVQRVFGMEYRPIKALEVLAPAGLKVVIHNVQVRRGLLVLVPEVFDILGGSVEDLEAARQRLVEEVNKPPRGRRTRTGSVPSLASRATRAAWPSDGVNSHGRSNTSMPQQTGSFERSDQGASFGSNDVSTRGRTEEHHFVPNARSSAESDHRFVPNVRSNLGSGPFSNHVVDPEEPMIDASRGNYGGDRGRVAESFAEPSARPSATFSTSATDTRGIAEGLSDRNVRSNVIPNSSSNPFVQPEEAGMVDSRMHINEDDIEMVAEDFAHSSVRSNAEPDESLTAASSVRDTDMTSEAEPPLILNGDKGVPFTYLSSLFAAMEDADLPIIQGNIKCFLAGVKEFHFKERDTFELRVHVDDGSLISEVLIDHNLVQKKIGHSPKEVVAAISSKDSRLANGMKETMKQFQSFLINFEGIMLVEINRSSPIPVALEMKQGCSSSDTWLLLRRLKTLTYPQTPPHQHLERIDPIEISP